MRNAVLGCLILFGILSGGCFGIPIHARTGPWTELHPILQALPTERVEIPAGDGVTLRGIWVEKDGPPVLLLYGSGMKIESSRKIISILHHGGYGVLCCDYRGTGNSSGRRDSRTLDDDARALWSWLKVNKRRPAGVVGISIGAIAATGLLTLPDPPEAVVLERLVDPNTVILHFVGQYTILGAIAAALLARPKVDLSVRHQIERTDTATLLLLPEHDVLFPARERDRLAKRAPDNVRVVTVPGGHLNAQLVDPTRWRAALLDFLDAKLRPGQPPLHRAISPDPAPVRSFARDGCDLEVELGEGPLPPRAVMMLFGLKSTRRMVIEPVKRTMGFRLPWRDSRKLGRLLGVRIVGLDFPRPFAARWIGKSDAPVAPK